MQCRLLTMEEVVLIDKLITKAEKMAHAVIGEPHNEWARAEWSRYFHGLMVEFRKQAGLWTDLRT